MYKFSRILELRIYRWQPVLPVVLLEVTGRVPVKSQARPSRVYLPDTWKWNGAPSPKLVIQLADQLHKCCLLETFVPSRNDFWLLSIQVVKKDNLFKNQGSGPRETQCLSVAVLSVDPSLVPSTHGREIKTTSNQSGIRWFRTLLLASTDPHLYIHVSMDA